MARACASGSSSGAVPATSVGDAKTGPIREFLPHLDGARVTPTSISLLILHMCTHDTDTRGHGIHSIERLMALAGLEDQYRLRTQVKVDEVPARRTRHASGACGAAPSPR